MPATIRIADDHESSRAGLEALLSLEGYNVLTAEDGIQALEQFRRTQPDLLLLDINMPNMRGTEVCRRIKNNPETLLVPVVLITGLTATEDRVTGIQAGADDFLCKPVDREQLIVRVRSLLRQKAFTDELERAEAVLFALARSIEEKDPYTEGHGARLAEYSARLGEHIGLSAPEIKALRRAGVVHDIGKVAVPDTILLKPARLTRTEQLILWRHPVIGERVLSNGAPDYSPPSRKNERIWLSGRSPGRGDSHHRARAHHRRRLRCANNRAALQESTWRGSGAGRNKERG